MGNIPLKNIFFVLLALVLIQSSTYTLMETEQALIFQMGRVKGGPIKEAGLHFKIPFIQKVKRFDKRVLILDGAPSEIPTRDRKFILVNTTARWQIKDPIRFYKSFRSTYIRKAMQRITSILDGVVKDAVSNYNLVELVRNSNKILQDVKDNLAEKRREKRKSGEDSVDLEEMTQEIEPIKKGREKISTSITKRAGEILFEQFGISLIDVQLKSIAYREEVEQKVYTRMVSERRKVAAKIISTGLGKKAEIEGQLDLSLKKIESEAYRKSQEIKGVADAKAIKIYASIMNADPTFYSFIKTLETYKSTLAQNGNYILSTDNEFLELFAHGK